ncbi:hypothetical protein L2X99_07270 [Microbacterium sp. KUDC0406]|uniref:hypothetical protein n=1 Tax=Microbacterium sp. KUDC0406 TaxID=2909588 RepID=UPI001F1EBB5D|nr:hypothetical protein [Microbacterium sp. KUDC0406]UJP11316.1 hypothetical protein L2X99_07270 [Microbacterium sp. KUDC0406]
MTDRKPEARDDEVDALREDEALEAAQSEAEARLEVEKGLGTEAFEGGIEG